MFKIDIEKDCVKLEGIEKVDKVYLVIRNNGLQVCLTKPDTVLPVYELQLKEGISTDEKMINLLGATGFDGEYDLVEADGSYVCRK